MNQSNARIVAEEEVLKANEKLLELTNQLDTAQDTILHLETSINELSMAKSKEIHNLQCQIAQQEADISKYTKQIEELNSEVTDLKAILARSEADITSSLTDEESLHKKCSQLQTQLDLKISEADKVQADIKELESEMKLNQRNFANETEELKNQLDSVHTEKDKLEKLLSQSQGAVEAISALEKRFEDMRNERNNAVEATEITSTKSILILLAYFWDSSELIIRHEKLLLLTYND